MYDDMQWQARQRPSPWILYKGKEEDVSHVMLVREKHDEAINADAEAGRGRHAHVEDAHKVFIGYGHLAVHASGGEGLACLLRKGRLLCSRVVLLRIGVGHFHAVDEELKALSIVPVGAAVDRLCEGAAHKGVVHQERGLHAMRLYKVSDELVDQVVQWGMVASKDDAVPLDGVKRVLAQSVVVLEGEGEACPPPELAHHVEAGKWPSKIDRPSLMHDGSASRDRDGQLYRWGERASQEVGQAAKLLPCKRPSVRAII